MEPTLEIQELITEYSKLKERYIMESGLGDGPTALLNRIEMFELYHAWYVEQSIYNKDKQLIMDNNQH